MESIAIRKISIVDISQLKQLGKQTFTEAFSAQNSEENINGYLKNAFSTEKLTMELENENAEFYFAEHDGKAIGYLKLNFGRSQTDIKDDNAVEVERIYILKEFYGKTAGQLLIDKAIEIATQKKADYLWLGVWEENPRAIRFYEKNGFVVFDKHLFKLGSEDQTDMMMKLNLKNA